jgi:hypothetical protein
MSPDSIFQICSAIAMLGWIVLLFISPFWLHYDKLLIGIIITLFGIVSGLFFLLSIRVIWKALVH